MHSGCVCARIFRRLGGLKTKWSETGYGLRFGFVPGARARRSWAGATMRRPMLMPSRTLSFSVCRVGARGIVPWVAPRVVLWLSRRLPAGFLVVVPDLRSGAGHRGPPRQRATSRAREAIRQPPCHSDESPGSSPCGHRQESFYCGLHNTLGIMLSIWDRGGTRGRGWAYPPQLPSTLM